VAMPLTSSSRDCPPRFATLRSSRQSLGGRVDQVAGLLGQPLMPWQRDVLDVALEVDPETGLLAYREVVLTVPRQSGKTWLLLCLMVHRALGFGEPQSIVYTAQNRLEARKKWEDDFVWRLGKSPLRHKFTVRKQIGQEAIRWENGSLQGVTSSTEKAGHGSTLDLAVLDEAFAHEDARLEQALKPAMVTRPEPQMWIVSTAGTAKSAFLRSKVTAGRMKARAGLQESSAFFEWSAEPDADPADPAVWLGCMPAVGHSIDRSVVRADFLTMELPEFRRAYLNQWPEQAGGGLIDEDAWAALTDPESCAVRGTVYALDISLDHQWAALALAGRRQDGRMHVSVDNRPEEPGIAWVVPRCAELARQHGAQFVLDKGGPAWALEPDLKDAGVNLKPMTLPDVRQACGMFLDAVVEGTVRHRGQPALDEAVKIAQPRAVTGEGGPVFGRKQGDITSLNAAAFAHWWAAANAYDVLQSVH
jgi:Phage Terminase